MECDCSSTLEKYFTIQHYSMLCDGKHRLIELCSQSSEQESKNNDDESGDDKKQDDFEESVELTHPEDDNSEEDEDEYDNVQENTNQQTNIEEDEDKDNDNDVSMQSQHAAKLPVCLKLSFMCLFNALSPEHIVDPKVFESYDMQIRFGWSRRTISFRIENINQTERILWKFHWVSIRGYFSKIINQRQGTSQVTLYLLNPPTFVYNWNYQKKKKNSKLGDYDNVWSANKMYPHNVNKYKKIRFICNKKIESALLKTGIAQFNEDQKEAIDDFDDTLISQYGLFPSPSKSVKMRCVNNVEEYLSKKLALQNDELICFVCKQNITSSKSLLTHFGHMLDSESCGQYIHQWFKENVLSGKFHLVNRLDPLVNNSGIEETMNYFGVEWNEQRFYDVMQYLHLMTIQEMGNCGLRKFVKAVIKMMKKCFQISEIFTSEDVVKNTCSKFYIWMLKRNFVIDTQADERPSVLPPIYDLTQNTNQNHKLWTESIINGIFRIEKYNNQLKDQLTAINCVEINQKIINARQTGETFDFESTSVSKRRKM
eukprot:530078_1